LTLALSSTKIKALSPELPHDFAAMPSQAKNVLGEPMIPCSVEPMTGFYRDGCCRTGPDDVGLHLVCSVMTDEFLAFSRARGNDLSTPNPLYQFPGLSAGDRWCLCVERWKEALEAGMAPQVVLAATHISALEFVDLEDLVARAVDSPSAR
jgi:uncharacterized protein (DUF2237 family)